MLKALNIRTEELNDSVVPNLIKAFEEVKALNITRISARKVDWN